MSGKNKIPSQGYIYFINPKIVVLKCRNKHYYKYDISGLDEVTCSHPSCSLTINSSQIIRGKHPYIIWNTFEKDPAIKSYHVIPLTSQNTFDGLPTTYSINPNQENGLNKNSRALIHQLTLVDSACFKDINGVWMERQGKISSEQKKEIEELVRYLFAPPPNPNNDWFKDNVSPTELTDKIFNYMEPDQIKEIIELLMDNI